jgi:hypothetical protein
VVLVVSIITARWLQYLTDGAPWVKAQPAAVVVTYGGVALAVVLGVLLRRSADQNSYSRWFLGLMGAAWVVHISITLLHGDAFNFNAWLYLPVLALLAVRPPTARELVVALRILGWSLAVVIVATLVLELTGVIDPMYMDPELVAWESDRYWLPLNGLLDMEGRWPGPFGHSGDTGAVAALVVVIGLAFRGRFAWIVVSIGVLGLLLTSVRVAMVATVVGIAILVLFSRSRLVQRIPMWLRLSAAILGVVAVVAVMLGQSSSLTGRTTIWPPFVDLWLTSPVTGVGATGIAANGGITALSVHAHNQYLDALVRTGLIGFLVQAAALGYGIWLSLRAMVRGMAGPMAVIAAYLVIGITQAMNDWIYPGIPVLALILCILLAAQTLHEGDDATLKSPPGPVDESAPTPVD